MPRKAETAEYPLERREAKSAANCLAAILTTCQKATPNIEFAETKPPKKY